MLRQFPGTAAGGVYHTLKLIANCQHFTPCHLQLPGGIRQYGPSFKPSSVYALFLVVRRVSHPASSP